MNGLDMPKITAAQILAVVKDAIAVAVAFGAPLSQTQQVALLTLAGSSTIVLVAADAMIRHARAKHVAGPLLDQAAASTILDAQLAARRDLLPPAPAPADPIAAATDRAAREAELEAEAKAANDARPTDLDAQTRIAAQAEADAAPAGIDPATL